MKTRHVSGRAPTPLLALGTLALFVSLTRPFLHARTSEVQAEGGGVCNKCPMYSLSVLEKRQSPSRPDLDFSPTLTCPHWAMVGAIPAPNGSNGLGSEGTCALCRNLKPH